MISINKLKLHWQKIYSKVKPSPDFPNSLQTPICLFCYHKAGTVLLTKVFGEICAANNWQFISLMGKQEKIPENYDVILFAHSLIDLSQVQVPFIGVHLVRDPRDIIVSGYLYHSRTTEPWCVNKDFSLEPPISFPQVPYSQEHRSEDWKINYLKSLNKCSYQEHLLHSSQEDGLLFEMNNYGSWTIESMQQWNYNQDNILEIKFEDIMNDYDSTFQGIFSHLGFSQSQAKHLLKIAIRHDLGRKSSKEIQGIKHVSKIKTSKWGDYFKEEHKRYFLNNFGDILIDLGYEASIDW